MQLGNIPGVGLTSIAPVDVTKAAAAVGTGVEAARNDHKHDVSTAVPVNLGITLAEGSATSLARSDHVHVASVLQSLHTEVTVDTTTTSTSFVDLLTITVNKKRADSVLLIWANHGGDNSGANTQFGRLTINGTAIYGFGYQVAGAKPNSGGCHERRTGLAAGNHTIKLQWRVDGGTGRIRPITSPDFGFANLTIIEALV